MDFPLLLNKKKKVECNPNIDKTYNFHLSSLEKLRILYDVLFNTLEKVMNLGIIHASLRFLILEEKASFITPKA